MSRSAVGRNDARGGRLTVTSVPPLDWQADLEACGGTLYHTVLWGEAHASPLSRPLFFRWRDTDGRCTAVAVGIERRSPAQGIGRLFRRLDFESYPALASVTAEGARDAIAQLVEYAADHGYRAVSVQSYAARVAACDLAAIGLTPAPRVEFVVDLTASAEESWKRLSSHHRRKIKRASAHRLTFAEARSLEALRQAREVQIQSRDRRVARGEEIPVGDDAYYERLGARLFAGEAGRVLLAAKDGEVVSAAFIWVYRGAAFYVFGGSSDAGFALDAPAWLFWEGFERCRASGCSEFNLGGVPASALDPDSPSHGLYRFKEGFGGRQVPCVSGHAENLTSRLQAAVGGVRDLWRSW